MPYITTGKMAERSKALGSGLSDHTYLLPRATIPSHASGVGSNPTLVIPFCFVADIFCIFFTAIAGKLPCCARHHRSLYCESNKHIKVEGYPTISTR
ncbi:uncharacterized protein BP01DRAFT_220745 [Aspergillus saccharolyticus JOP 1030-1]|uniref:Uncharacterized protein n=1 Tax=Aspergillus saccharolyticus JOP 1030-1 TaxID=1450539 RepID=A0A318ZTL4_9EURO|nr:hypothetical protein BP01DRAFT_220745 [Aspergillus saccharolyticus JOP 1030-1]PYH47643.1 hypothetical protein BP01DRAFT_220745 [Aspergillus saccharolyticus JOP 1030-1]